MDLIVFGATGGTGRHVVDTALNDGHAVTAFVRDPARVHRTHPDLRVLHGDVRDLDATGRACEGKDAALIVLGAPALDRGTVRTIGTRHVVAAAERAGVRRLVCLSTVGVGDSRAALSPLYRYLLVPLLLHRAFADHEGQERVIHGSGLDWTIVRAGALTDGPTGRGKVSRAEVAAFLVEQVTDVTSVRRTPLYRYGADPSVLLYGYGLGARESNPPDPGTEPHRFEDREGRQPLNASTR
jgi:uncharacterized protein YbjT (DUF2867 family)